MILDARWDLALGIGERRHIPCRQRMGKSDYLQHQLRH
jgi:hypothetical protein